MNPNQIVKEMLSFHEKAFDNGHKVMVMVQDQNERVINRFMEQAASFPLEGKKFVHEWTNAFKKGREAYHTFVEAAFKHVEEFFTI